MRSMRFSSMGGVRCSLWGSFLLHDIYFIQAANIPDLFSVAVFTSLPQNHLPPNLPGGVGGGVKVGVPLARQQVGGLRRGQGGPAFQRARE